MHRYTQTSMATNLKQLVRAANDVCVVMYEAAKSHLCTCIVQYAILTYIHTERPYMGTFSAIYRHPYTGKTSHQYTTACSRRHVNHLAIHCLESSPCKTQHTQRGMAIYADIEHQLFTNIHAMPPKPLPSITYTPSPHTTPLTPPPHPLPSPHPSVFQTPHYTRMVH